MKCENCGLENREGALVCERCGMALVATVTTKELQPPQEAVDMDVTSRTIRLHIKGVTEPVIVNPEGKPVVLGRQGGADSGSAFVDLDRYGALDLGVSRRHATLRWELDQLMLIDLGSINYTFLNGRRLRANRPYELRDGDNISLGKLSMSIFF